MAVECTFYGGAGDYKDGELGGVQGMFYDRNALTSFLLDCGQRPDHTSQYYGFPYSPKSFQYLAISEFLNLYSGLEDILRHDYQRHRGMQVGGTPELEIVITHPHYDHMGGLTLARHDAKVHMHRVAKRMGYIWQYLSGKSLNQFVDLIDQLSVVNNNEGNKKFVTGLKAVMGRDINTFGDYDTFKVGNIECTAYPVDHSLPGSCGFIFDTSAGKIGVSGDIRLRGRRRAETERFIDALLEQKVRYLFWEGSLLHFDHNGTEDDVAMKVAELVRGRTFASVAMPPRDLDRLTSMHMAAKATGRTLCVTPAQMVYLKEFDGEYGYPLIDDPNIAVLLPRKRKGLLDREDFPDDMAESDYYYWERQFLRWQRWSEGAKKSDPRQMKLFEGLEMEGGNKKCRQRVTLEDISKYPDKFLVLMPFNNMIEIFEEVRPPANSIFIRSHPGPWTKEMEIQEDRQINILKRFGMYEGPQPDHLTPSIVQRMHQVHITGHLNRRENREVFSRFGKETTIVVYHAMHPNDFPEDVAKHLNVIVPNIGEQFLLE